ncbi:MAG: helix-turn-helix transcriptional regulator [bacterium]|nr:helix-turn-helix transcriptional regulator [bacterium]
MNTDTIKSLGLRIRQVRKQLGLVQTQFGHRMGISKSSVINYETGKRIPDALFLIRLLERFDINPKWLMLGIGNMNLERGEPGKAPDDPQIDEGVKQLIHDMRIPLIKYGIMAECARLKKVYKPLLKQYLGDE